jgi:hypothetical protein
MQVLYTIKKFDPKDIILNFIFEAYFAVKTSFQLNEKSTRTPKHHHKNHFVGTPSTLFSIYNHIPKLSLSICV